MPLVQWEGGNDFSDSPRSGGAGGDEVSAADEIESEAEPTDVSVLQQDDVGREQPGAASGIGCLQVVQYGLV